MYIISGKALVRSDKDLYLEKVKQVRRRGKWYCAASE